MIEIDVFCKDLLLKSRIKEEAARQGLAVRVLRSLDDYKSKQLEPSGLLIVDANGYEDSLEQFALMTKTLRADGGTVKVSCFVAHVDEVVIAKAETAGISDISPRSAFFNSLGRRLTAFIANPT